MAGGETPPPPVKIDPSSPFYLGSQDRSGDFITPIRLKLDNFDDWSHAIRVALSSRRKFGFLDGTINDLVPPCTKDDWVTIHCMLVSWLTNTIDPEVRSMLSNYDNAKRLWDDLHERFSVVNGPHIQQLKADINRYAQSKTMPVAVYFSKLTVLWDELDNHEPLICCKCGKCTCEVGKQHGKRREDDRLQQFLLGLCSEYYAQLRSTILSQDPLPSLNRVFQQIAQDERVRGITRITKEKPEVVGFAVRMANRTQPRLDRAERAALVCSHCHKSGHDIATCFDLHGTPDWYLEKYGNTYEGKGNVKGKTNAPSTKTSAGRGRGGVRANATTPDITHSAPLGQPSPAPGAQPLPGFTAEQWAALTAAFGTPQTPSNRLHGKLGLDAWIIDTGCSNHVTGEESCLLDIKVVSACPVGLPDGQTVDLHSREVIGTGERRDGLYYLRQGSKVQAVSVDSSQSLELWHSRLGHPSEKTITPTVESDVTYNGGDIEEFLDDVGGHRALHEDVIVATQTPQTASPTTSDTPSHEETQPSSTSVLSQNAWNVPTVAASSTGAGGVDGTTGGSRGDNLGRGLREKFPSVKLRDYVTHTVIKKSPSLAPPDPDSHTPSGTPFPIAHDVSCDKFTVKHQNFLAAVTAGAEPQSFKEAVAGGMEKQEAEWTLDTEPEESLAIARMELARARETRIAVCIDLWWATRSDFLKEIPKQRTEKTPESERLSFCTATLFLYSGARIRGGLFLKIRIAAITGLPVFIVGLLVHRRRGRRRRGEKCCRRSLLSPPVERKKKGQQITPTQVAGSVTELHNDEEEEVKILISILRNFMWYAQV
ncbi:hypothetical protein MRB53_021434 [Persea americana]|uniref:Uncharacterized protein n=1 Tax=Persea americana TaxID=3435 RepID=A0ACC2L4W0_PERAE|nr:hypothetical protein MRB53_021434 [Persea americana]